MLTIFSLSIFKAAYFAIFLIVTMMESKKFTKAFDIHELTTNAYRNFLQTIMNTENLVYNKYYLDLGINLAPISMENYSNLYKSQRSYIENFYNTYSNAISQIDFISNSNNLKMWYEEDVCGLLNYPKDCESPWLIERYRNGISGILSQFF
jgi:hypothetical protein